MAGLLFTAQTPAVATGSTGVYGAAPNAKQEQQQIQSSGNSQWAALGSVPSTNLAWMQSVEDSTNPNQSSKSGWNYGNT